MILLFVTFWGTTVWAQTPQSFDMKEDTGFYYTIQKGDTLWDLSQKFYNSQWDWPGLWELNRKIKNPHWIYPGNKIRVYLKGSRQQAMTADSRQPIKGAGIPMFNFPAMDNTGFIKTKEVPAAGTIIREQDGNLLMSFDDIIYIRPETASALQPGEVYQIFNTENITEKIKADTYRGVRHQIKGQVKILQINERYATGRIISNFRYATIGDKLMPFYHRDATFPVESHPAPIDAAILFSEDNERMVNDHRVAFINKGSTANVRPGQIYRILQIQKNLSYHDVKDVELLDPLDSGRIIVLHSEAQSATVLVLSSKREIKPGDLIQ